MADEAEQTDELLDEQPGAGKKLLILLGVALVIAGVCAAAGFGLGRMLAPEQAEAESPERPAPDEPGGNYAYYTEFPAITVNLDDPQLSRYIRATITLAIHPRDYASAKTLIEAKTPELKNWLTVYLAGCTLNDVRGPKNLNRIRREIADAFNARLSDEKLIIRDVLFKDFAVQ